MRVRLTDPSSTPPAVLVGGVGQLFQGDLDVGRLAVEQLSDLAGDGVVVEDLHYGAVAVTQLLEDLRPGTLLLVGACERGRTPGTVERRYVDPPQLSSKEAQQAVEESITGYVSVELVVEVAAALGALPDRAVTLELEPAATDPSDELSAAAREALPQLCQLVRAEVRRVPLLDLAEEMRGQRKEADLEASAGVEALDALLAELRVLEREGRWGRVFAERDRLRACVRSGDIGEGASKLDWAQWWTLIELLDREQGAAAVSV